MWYSSNDGDDDGDDDDDDNNNNNNNDNIFCIALIPGYGINFNRCKLCIKKENVRFNVF